LEIIGGNVLVAYTIIPNSDIDSESPVTENLLTYLRDNPIAIANATTLAPRVQSSAIANNAITLSHLVRSDFGVLRSGETERIAMASSIQSLDVQVQVVEPPVIAQLWAECVASTAGYVPGDEVLLGNAKDRGVGSGLFLTVRVDSPNFVRYNMVPSDPSNFYYLKVINVTSRFATIYKTGNFNWRIYTKAVS